MQKLLNFYFTFGYGHKDSNNYKLDDHYTVIKAVDYETARRYMITIWGSIWAFQYKEKDFLKSNHLKGLIYVPCPPSDL